MWIWVKESCWTVCGSWSRVVCSREIRLWIWGANSTPPTVMALAGGTPGARIQGRSLLPLFTGRRGRSGAGWRKSFLMEYWAENAYPWLIGMTYKAVRTQRHKYIRWVNRSRDGELDELYDLDRDPYEIANVINRPAYRAVRDRLRRELRRLAVEAGGL